MLPFNELIKLSHPAMKLYLYAESHYDKKSLLVYLPLDPIMKLCDWSSNTMYYRATKELVKQGFMTKFGLNPHFYCLNKDLFPIKNKKNLVQTMSYMDAFMLIRKLKDKANHENHG